MSLGYIRDYYDVPAEIGRDVKVSNRLGTIVGDMGQYIGVKFHDDVKRNVLPCHPTSEVVYLDTFTNVETLRTKNYRSKERYRQYLSEDGSLTFGEWLKAKSNEHRAA